MPRRRAAAACALGLAVLTAAIAHATVVRQADVALLTTTCDRAVDGTIRAKRIVHEVEQGRIWTEYDVAVARTLVGKARRGGEAERVTVSVPGGTAAGITQEVHGAVRMAAGERYVLFLTREAGRWLALGEAQGCLHVKKDPESGQLVAQSDVTGLLVLDAGGNRVEARGLRLPLPDLETQVRDALREKERRERARQAAIEKKLAGLRERAKRSAEWTRGKPGGAD